MKIVDCIDKVDQQNVHSHANEGKHQCVYITYMNMAVYYRNKRKHSYPLSEIGKKNTGITHDLCLKKK